MADPGKLFPLDPAGPGSLLGWASVGALAAAMLCDVVAAAAVAVAAVAAAAIQEVQWMIIQNLDNDQFIMNITITKVMHAYGRY